MKAIQVRITICMGINVYLFRKNSYSDVNSKIPVQITTIGTRIPNDINAATQCQHKKSDYLSMK